MKRADWILAGAALVLALAGYLAWGAPGMADQPMAARDARLTAKDPAQMTPGEALARLERMTQTRPDDPEPHYFIGRLLAEQGREDDAIRAYQSALRRDDRFVPAMVALADAFVRLAGGEVGADASRIYQQAWQLDPAQTRAGFLVGLSHWQAGRTSTARETWQRVGAKLAAGSDRAIMLDAWVEAATENAPAGNLEK